MKTHPNFKSILFGGAFLFLAIVLPSLFHPAEAWAVGSVVTGTVTDASGGGSLVLPSRFTTPRRG